MKSSELRTKLAQLESQYGDLEVITEGCDCIGASGDVTLNIDEFIIERGTPEDKEEIHRRHEEQEAYHRQRRQALEAQYPGMLP